MASETGVTNAGLSATTLNVRTISLRFLFGVTRGCEGMKRYMQFLRQPRKLPVVPSVEEVHVELVERGPNASHGNQCRGAASVLRPLCRRNLIRS